MSVQCQRNWGCIILESLKIHCSRAFVFLFSFYMHHSLHVLPGTLNTDLKAWCGIVNAGNCRAVLQAALALSLNCFNVSFNWWLQLIIISILVFVVVNQTPHRCHLCKWRFCSPNVSVLFLAQNYFLNEDPAAVLSVLIQPRLNVTCGMSCHIGATRWQQSAS